MVDLKVKQKARNKINKLVDLKLKESGGLKDEKTIRKEIMTAERLKRKKNKNAEVEKIKEDVKASMAGKEQKLIDKAMSKAVAKYYSKLKKARHPQTLLKTKAESVIVNVNSQLWCPSDQAWWDDQCQSQFEDYQLLAGMCQINLLKDPQNFLKLFPDECKTYFDFLSKKRFSSAALKEEISSKSRKSKKSVVQIRFEEQKADPNNKTKSDKELMKDVIDEIGQKEKKMQLKNMRQYWKPAQKPWFDNECAEAFASIEVHATSLQLDLENNLGDYKKLKNKSKAKCSEYFKLLEGKRIAFNLERENKEKRKSETEEASKPVNKKIKFELGDEDAEEVDEAEKLKAIEKALKKEKRKKAKLLKKESIKVTNQGIKAEKVEDSEQGKNKKAKKKEKKKAKLLKKENE